MKNFKVIFDNEIIDGIDVKADNLNDAKIYVNNLVNNFEFYGFTVEEV